ncbi:hypothetical protein J4E81_000657 [Alternaria sp. BMP 2799]|nr:hypothetical protein J4E81_000657 [Alternaria sp. BMP 2799]
MRTLATLLVSPVAIFLGKTSATPVKYTGVQRSENGTNWRPSVGILSTKIDFIAKYEMDLKLLK